jgi:hypothetical protein
VTKRRRWRTAAGAVVLVAALGVAALGVRELTRTSPCPARPDEVSAERPVDLAHAGPILDADELLAPPAPTLVVQVTNTERSEERVRLSIDGRTALDVDLPSAPPSHCAGADHPPVFSVAYRLPSGSTEVVLDLQGAGSTEQLDLVEGRTTWAVVQVQSERAWGDVTTYDTRPQWG